ncbi:hypothetical protein EDB89DRAFT_2155382 [Lactarius sanguifluus]|nr:hypothetical protein EDB89DRAFT_2155382 [Lactarius sanguifluus]
MSRRPPVIMRYCWISVLFLLSAVPLDGLATSRWEDMRSKHSWNTIPENWKSLGLPPADTMIDLYIALKPYHENALIDALNEVSDPGHPRHVSSAMPSLRMYSLLRYRYGAHLSKEQVADIVAPHPDTVQLVHSWLGHHRVLSSSISVTHGGSFLTVTGTKTNETIIRTLGYSLPVMLHGHRGSSGAGRSAPAEPVTAPPSHRGGGDDGDADVTPAFLRWLYSTFAYVPSATDRNMVGVMGLGEEYPSPADLTSYMREFHPDGIDATYVVALLGEGMTYPTPHIFYSTKASPNGDVYFTWLDAVLSQAHVPQTITTSYGNYEKLHPMEYAMQGDCKTDDGTVQFTPFFQQPVRVAFLLRVPGAGTGCSHGHTFAGPYVTCRWRNDKVRSRRSQQASPVAVSRNTFRALGTKQQAVSTFFDHLGPQYSGLYNPVGRGIPDIAAQAMAIPFFYRGTGDNRGRNKLLDASASLLPLSSLCRPSSSVTLTAKVQIVAGIISLLNDHRLSQGKRPLGFSEPLALRGRPQGLHDIVSGSNPGCNTDGFSAIAGWDPVRPASLVSRLLTLGPALKPPD